MRAKIASRSHGHAFEKRFLELTPEQLVILYRHAVAEEQSEKEQQAKLIRAISEMWVQNFETFFDELKAFVNPDMFKRLHELKSLNALRQEVKTEEFPDLWNDLMKVIPNTYVVDEDKPQLHNLLPSVDSETEKLLAGWVPMKKYTER